MVFKKNILLLALSALLFSINIIEARSARKVCQKAECTLPNCTCYCSVKCGPRSITSKDDPHYDKKTGKCFCAARDWKLYKKNKCAIKNAKKKKRNRSKT